MEEKPAPKVIRKFTEEVKDEVFLIYFSIDKGKTWRLLNHDMGDFSDGQVFLSKARAEYTLEDMKKRHFFAKIVSYKIKDVC